MPKFRVTWIDWGDDDGSHATRRASRSQVSSILMGEIEARPNKKTGRAKWVVSGVADDGSRWVIPFNYEDGIATPITSIPVK